ncbi:preprotein translocase subunit SecD family protein [Halorussus halophilus]|uniref:hypothetical protein n=1 Tax=Halorussus halophilus TaxID=2650975 RepID=UPI0013014A10|nr:hypothetical protein [Halorussus halophilus]
MPSRRQVLAAGSLALAGSAGCLGGSTIGIGGTDDTTDSSETVATSTVDQTTAASEATTADETSLASATSADADAFRIVVVDSDDEVQLVTGVDVASVGEIESASNGSGYRLPFRLTDDGTTAFADGLEQVGAFDNPEDHQIRTYFEAELLYEAELGPGLADEIESGEWNGEFLFTVSERQTAESVKAALKK